MPAQLRRIPLSPCSTHLSKIELRDYATTMNEFQVKRPTEQTRTEHGTRKGTSQFPIIFIIGIHSMRQDINKTIFDEVVFWLK